MHTPAEQQTQGGVNAGATSHPGTMGEQQTQEGAMPEPSPTQGQIFYNFTQTGKQPVATALPLGYHPPSPLLDTQKGHGKDSSQGFTVPGSPV